MIIVEIFKTITLFVTSVKFTDTLSLTNIRQYKINLGYINSSSNCNNEFTSFKNTIGYNYNILRHAKDK